MADDGVTSSRGARGVWSVNGQGQARDGRTGRPATTSERQALLRRLDRKVRAGRASVTERRCLAALRRAEMSW